MLYILKSAITLALLYNCFFFFLSKETFHRFNRCMLVGIMLTSLIVPLLHFTTEHPTVINEEVYLVQTYIEHDNIPIVTTPAAVHRLTWVQVVAAVYLTYICYIFALQAQFENSFIAHIKNTFLLAFVAPGQTVLMWIVLAAPVLVILLLPEYIVAYIGFIFILFGISVPVYLNSKILIKIFSRFIPSEEPDEEERIIE
jgi:hypothetical protein